MSLNELLYMTVLSVGIYYGFLLLSFFYKLFSAWMIMKFLFFYLQINPEKPMNQQQLIDKTKEEYLKYLNLMRQIKINKK